MRSPQIVLAVVFLLGPVNADAQGQAGGVAKSSAARYTPAELRALGQRIVAQAVAEHGHVTDATSVAEVDTVLVRLESAAGIAPRSVEAVIVGDTEPNAAAVPGHYMLVNVGMLHRLRAFAAEDHRSDATGAERQYIAFLAAVLGHELGHVTLGHTDDLGTPETATVASSPPATSTAPEALARLMAHPEALVEAQHTREQETAADRVGSLYALRAGWRIEDAIELFRKWHSGEKRGDNTGTVEDLTWLRDHPRSSERIAALEEFRGQLLRDQTRFDDARTLVRTGVAVEAAVPLIDTVLADFPHLIPAEQLRAAALHRQFLRLVPAAQLQMVSAVGTYDTDFVGRIRGSGMSSQARLALTRAIGAYESVLRESLVPYALSNLAVLNAYDGNLRLAVAQADSARHLAPSDSVVALNSGVVLYLAGQPMAAVAALTSALQTGLDCDGCHFDLARAQLAAGDTVAAARELAAYIENSDDSEWRDLALGLVASITPKKSGGHSVASERLSPKPVSDAVVLPVRPGDTPGSARLSLGAPATITALPQHLSRWDYPARGLSLVIASEPDRIAIVILAQREAGSIDGVRVGDPVARATAAWGTADENSDDGILYFLRGHSVIAVDVSGQRAGTIRMLGASEKRTR